MAQNGNVVYNTILQFSVLPEKALQLIRNEVCYNVKEIQHPSFSFTEACENNSPDSLVLDHNGFVQIVDAYFPAFVRSDPADIQDVRPDGVAALMIRF